MLDNLTPIKEIKKLPYGTITTVNLNSFEVDYRQYFKIKKTKREGSKREFIEGIDERIRNAVELEWSKDSDYSTEHFTLLSGGLDSRVNAMLGAKLAKRKIHSLTFSKPNTPDEKIASRIAKDLGFNHRFISMEGGKYLVGNEYEYVQANDGLVGYYGAAHQQYALQKTDLKGKGLLHTGQIGDVLFGSFTRKKSSIEHSFHKLFFHADATILSKIGALQEMKGKGFGGADLEIFSLEKRQINGTMNGDRCCSHLADSVSPFYNKELLKYCLSIPDRFKYNEAIYLDWMNACQPQLAKYKWAATEARPSNSLTQKTLSFKNRAVNYLFRKAGLDRKNMNPFESWYHENSNYSSSLEKIYQNRMLEGLDEDLKKDISYCYQKDNVIAKMLAITAILSYKLHFLD
jgi:asparagine synthase (glutamine-hydrolysing)